nr:alpha/beta fold hydrolase [Paroceanicella profunda]
MAPPRIGEEDDPLSDWARLLDHASRAALARSSGGLSPAALTGHYLDWAMHLAASPGKQTALMVKALRKAARFRDYLAAGLTGDGTQEPCIAPLPQDRRFRDPAWQQPPFNLYYQSFLLTQQWWHNATTGVRGVSKSSENAIAFTARQLLDMVSPANFLFTNPEALERTRAEAGQNLVRGMGNLLEDIDARITGKTVPGREDWAPGKTLAVSPGMVVFRNRLMELIQYAPTTDTVRPEPVVICPAWIMKYYILDLSPENSMVRYLTGQGYTVFMISWKNPDEGDRELGMEDYRTLGPMAAFDAALAITGAKTLHAVGYCLGGTLLTIAAAAMAREADARLASVTLFAAQSDFSEAGELMLFINESEVSFLEDMMWERGYLDSSQMAGAFQLLRSNDLIWSRNLKVYLMGEREGLNDLMAWNADATRMPYRMHAQYLRRLFLDNDLANGKFEVAGRPVSLTDIEAPIFAVGTETDHVAPWKSAYKVHRLTETEVTFVLTTGGHNAGVVSEPGHPHRHYRVHTTLAADPFMDADHWAETAEPKQGSWWPEWVSWLGARSGAPVAPPPMGAPGKGLPPLADAPGTYVLME